MFLAAALAPADPPPPSPPPLRLWGSFPDEGTPEACGGGVFEAGAVPLDFVAIKLAES